MADLSVVAFNLHWGRGHFFPYHGEPFDVTRSLRSYDADIFVLPEHFREHSGVGITDALRDDGYEVREMPFITLAFGSVPRVESPGLGWWTLAVASRLPILDDEPLSIGHAFRDTAGPRNALRVGIEVGDTRLDVVAVHTSSKLWFANPAVHLARLRPHLDMLRDRPAIVAGDCNLWGPLVERLLPGWRRAVKGRTFPAPRPHSQIDHVLVNDHVHPRGGEVLGRTPSDHRPIRARLSVG